MYSVKLHGLLKQITYSFLDYTVQTFLYYATYYSIFVDC